MKGLWRIIIVLVLLVVAALGWHNANSSVQQLDQVQKEHLSLKQDVSTATGELKEALYGSVEAKLHNSVVELSLSLDDYGKLLRQPTGNRKNDSLAANALVAVARLNSDLRVHFPTYFAFYGEPYEGIDSVRISFENSVAERTLFPLELANQWDKFRRPTKMSDACQAAWSNSHHFQDDLTLYRRIYKSLQILHQTDQKTNT